ncbi:MAG: superoxide dismutase family protein [Deltaproteobacteria bacterium]|nr:superoxide dismutase family protein [Deltaproteobacteria bacterium]
MHRMIIIAMLALPIAACSRGNEVAVATLQPKSGAQVTGTVTFTQKGDRVEVVANVKNLTPGKHGIHVHEKGDCSASDASSAGGHFAPGGGQHAGPTDPKRHAGDLGNLEAGADGSATLTTTTDMLHVGSGDHDVIGRAIIIHGDPDDLATQPSGNSGGRIACGVIEKKVD